MIQKIDSWQKFAKATIETNDLDPTYVFLWNAKKELGEQWAARFAVHYLCFYDMGGAIQVANDTNGASFWPVVLDNYDKWPRGTERRHSRGDLGRFYATNLSKHGTPDHILSRMYAPTYTGLVKLFRTEFVNCGFGTYFQWKVLDFQERIWERPISVSLDEAAKYCPEDPVKCARKLWPDKSFKDALADVTDEISQYLAPPSGNRPCSYQEAETILCMLKGYFITKQHTIGDDVDSKYKQLKDWPEFHKFLPARQDWGALYERATLVP